ncbi:retinoic acid-induced protein 2 [Pangasianodon hypophthalmus]|uniref:retinoic acid-induced protein 2 n=1 Tax=Pangasianodon hypophthalmus TaxID=310915 RepID=UPI0023081A3A|nr:retinoic acid-induced protein 2 [Pangasianodon hypophthalmus]
MEGLHREPCQFVGVETKAHKEAEDLEEPTLPSETWSKNSNKATGPVHSSEVVVEDSTISIPFSEPLLGLIVKMPASLQPVCFGGSPVMLPVEVQLAGGVEPQTIATPIITPTPGCLTLPLIFDQPHMQYLSPLSSCPITEHQNLPQSLQQNNGLSQNLSLPMGQSPSGEGKSNISQPSENTAMLSSEFLAALQELFPFLRNYSSSACRESNSFPLNAFSSGFIPPNTTLSHLYTGSPLVSLLPPATLLVPFPFVVPLPVPLPIPIPIPPFPDSGSRLKTSKSTQTMTEDIPVCTHNRMSGYDFLQFPTQPPPPVSQEEVLDLTVKVVPIQTKQEVQFSFCQDNILDLSVANKSCIETGKDTKQKHHGRNSTNEESTKLILPVKRSQTQATNQSNGYSDVEFSMQYKWTTEERYENYALKYSGQNGRVITPKQIPRVTRSTKDTSVMFCEKLVRPPQGQVLKNRAVKQKRVNSQNINIPPIKKQHLMTFLPTK